MKKNTYEYHDFSSSPLSIMLNHYKLNKKSTKWINWHSNLEVIYVDSGEGFIVCNGIQYPLQQGSLFVVNSNFLHYISTDSILYYHFIIVDSVFLSSNGITPENREYQNYIVSEKAAEKFNSLVKEYNSTNPFHIARVNSKLLDFMAYISTNFSSEINTSSSNTPSVDIYIKNSVKYIQSHLTERLTIDALASISGLSKDYFSHSFKNIIGITPITYINQLRCDSAKNLLKQKKYSIHEIATMCGFENDSYFSKTFKKYIGESPKEYLKSHPTK